MEPVEQRLRDARERIKRGWTQGVYHDLSCNAYCMVGAVDCDREYSVIRDATRLLLFVLGDEMALTVWNDQANRKKAEVILAFDEAIKVAKILGV